MGSHPYLVCGSIGGDELPPAPRGSLQAALRTAAKMRDQGVDDVRVTDSAGRPVPETGTRNAWSTGGDGLVIKRRRMDGR